MSTTTLHLLGIFHTQLNDEFSHCAFSGKARRFAKMMRPLGYKVVTYCNEGSVTESDEQVTILTAKEFERFYPRTKATDFVGNYAVIGERGWPTFHGRLIEQLHKRLQPGDVVCHPFGKAHEELVKIFPNHPHVETGIGYGDEPFGCWRIFESEAWRHWHWGWSESKGTHKEDKGMNRIYSWVIPNYFDLGDWPFSDGTQGDDSVLFMGRIGALKGTITIAETIRALAQERKLVKFVFAGQGDFEGEVMKHVLKDPKPDEKYLDIEYVGPVTGARRAELMGRARCCILASNFIEPFAGSVVEGMLCGTPAIGPNFGAFTETIKPGFNGYRCNTLGDYMAAIEACKKLERVIVASHARSLYSLEAVGPLYHAAFQQILEIGNGPGWYSKVSHRIKT